MAQYQALYGTILWNGAEAVAGDVLDVDETDPEQAAQLALWGSKMGDMAGISQIPANPELLKQGVIPLFAALNLGGPVTEPPPGEADRGRNFFTTPSRQLQAPATPRPAPPVPPAPRT